MSKCDNSKNIKATYKTKASKGKMKNISSIFDRQIIFDKFVETKSKLRKNEEYLKKITEKTSEYYIGIAIKNRDNRIISDYIKYVFSIFIIIVISIFITKAIYLRYLPDTWLVTKFNNIIKVLAFIFVITVGLVIFSVESDKNIIDSLVSLVVVLKEEKILDDKEHRLETISSIYNHRDSVGSHFIKIKNFIKNSNVLKYYNFLPPFFIGILTTYFSGVLKLEESITGNDILKILSLIISLFITLSLIYIILYVGLYMLIRSEIWNDELYKISLENLIYICTLSESKEIIDHLYSLGVSDAKGEETSIMRNLSEFEEYNVEIFKKYLWDKIVEKSYQFKIKLLIVFDLSFSYLYFNCTKCRINLVLFLLYLLSLMAVFYLKYNSSTKVSKELLEKVRCKDSEDINNVFQSLNKTYNKTYIFKFISLVVLFLLIIPKRVIFNDFSSYNNIIIVNIIILLKSSILVVFSAFIINELINFIKIDYLMNLNTSNN